MAQPINTYRTITPYLVVADAESEIRFLEEAFGATVNLNQRNGDGSVMHAELTIGDSQLMLGQASELWKPRQAALYLWVPDCDENYHKAIAAGALSESAPEDKPYGHRNAGVVDPNGIIWWIGSPIAK
ncbi:MAG: VOC family protein [Bryobacter sp.]|nr:VOC family protein [Bryobacter sp.]